MTNPQPRKKHRTTMHVAELCLQSAEDYHQQYLCKVPDCYYPDHSADVDLPGRHPSGLDGTTAPDRHGHDRDRQGDEHQAAAAVDEINQSRAICSVFVPADAERRCQAMRASDQ
jgi:hypothetical protein